MRHLGAIGAVLFGALVGSSKFWPLSVAAIVGVIFYFWLACNFTSVGNPSVIGGQGGAVQLIT